MKMVFQARKPKAERILGEHHEVSGFVGVLKQVQDDRLATKKRGESPLKSVSTWTIAIHHVFVGCC